ncbi:MAG TPA: hypothetical protein VH914_19135 [Acidimicrobiia bacterium]|nr:hypothetical protein [Acidimicrobiia bacterium]
MTLIGFGGVAGATTLSVSVPGLLDGSGASHPIVTIGTGSPTTPPVPGTDALVPAHVDVHLHPNASSVPVSDPTGQTSQLVRLGDTHVKVDACIAATILSGDDPQSCPGAIDGANPIVGQVSALQDAGTLPRALADVGGCVEVRQAAGAPIDTCTASIPTGSLPTGSLPTGSLPTGSLPTGSLPTGLLPTGSLPTGSLGDVSNLGSLPSGAALDPTTVTKALSTSGLCDLVGQLGLDSLLSCSNSAAAPSVPVGTTAGSPVNAKTVCLGLAAVINVDTGLCSSNGASTPAAHAHATVKARHDGGATAVTGAGTTPAQLNGSCVANVGASSSSSSPFSPMSAGGFAGAGFGLAALGKLLRRLRNPLAA